MATLLRIETEAAMVLAVAALECSNTHRWDLSTILSLLCSCVLSIFSLGINFFQNGLHLKELLQLISMHYT